jgi:hypothetical protein
VEVDERVLPGISVTQDTSVVVRVKRNCAGVVIGEVEAIVCRRNRDAAYDLRDIAVVAASLKSTKYLEMWNSYSISSKQWLMRTRNRSVGY